jgi:hypothetical protein
MQESVTPVSVGHFETLAWKQVVGMNSIVSSQILIGQKSRSVFLARCMMLKKVLPGVEMFFKNPRTDGLAAIRDSSRGYDIYAPSAYDALDSVGSSVMNWVLEVMTGEVFADALGKHQSEQTLQTAVSAMDGWRLRAFISGVVPVTTRNALYSYGSEVTVTAESKSRIRGRYTSMDDEYDDKKSDYDSGSESEGGYTEMFKNVSKFGTPRGRDTKAKNKKKPAVMPGKKVKSKKRQEKPTLELLESAKLVTQKHKEVRASSVPPLINDEPKLVPKVDVRVKAEMEQLKPDKEKEVDVKPLEVPASEDKEEVASNVEGRNVETKNPEKWTHVSKKKDKSKNGSERKEPKKVKKKKQVPKEEVLADNLRSKVKPLAPSGSVVNKDKSAIVPRFRMPKTRHAVRGQILETVAIENKRKAQEKKKGDDPPAG